MHGTAGGHVYNMICYYTQLRVILIFINLYLTDRCLDNIVSNINGLHFLPFTRTQLRVTVCSPNININKQSATLPRPNFLHTRKFKFESFHPTTIPPKKHVVIVSPKHADDSYLWVFASCIQGAPFELIIWTWAVPLKGLGLLFR